MQLGVGASRDAQQRPDESRPCQGPQYSMANTPWVGKVQHMCQACWVHHGSHVHISDVIGGQEKSHSKEADVMPDDLCSRQ